MKAMLLTTAMAAGIGLPAMAQDAGSPFQSQPTGASVMASNLIGARIYASEANVDAEGYAGLQEGWNDIGEVNDIVLGRDGSVDAVLVDIGGFLGMGERQVAVDMSSLRFVQDDATDADDWFLVMQANRESLDTAPEWTQSGMRDGALGTGTDMGAGTDTGVGTDVESGAEYGADTGVGMDQLVAGREGYTSVDGNTLTSEMLQGVNVYGSNDQSIAEVSNLVLASDGKVTDVVLDVGGFLGMGEKTVALPLDRLTIAQDEGGLIRIWVDMTEDELEALPEFENL